MWSSPLMEAARGGPKRRRVECRLIEDESAREVTFSKRHQGLFRKAAELSVLCGAEVAIIAYSPHGNPFAFAHPSTPDALIDRYLSGGRKAGPAAAEAAAAAAVGAAHRERYEDAAAKLEEAKREAERIVVEAGKRNRWWDEAVADRMEEEELEQYVASLEALRKLVAERVEQCGDLGFYSRLLATDISISMGLDTAFLAELQYSC